MYRRFVVLTIVSLASAPAGLLAQGGGGPPQQQQPPKNLQVLPKDFTRGQVVQIMRGVAIGLGVRCEYCHVEGPDKTFQTMDFASDEKDTKKTAREMMKMAMDINAKYLTGTMGRTLTERSQVRCVTCHHGVAKPRTLQSEIATSYESGGADSAAAKYKMLRERYYGRAAYDFGEMSLVEVADELGRKPDQRRDALKMLQMNLEYFPKSGMTFTALANGSLQMGDTVAAVAAYQKALEFDPENPMAKRMLGVLKK
jgi:tetratricopeptide (TPR) repeat protein